MQQKKPSHLWVQAPTGKPCPMPGNPSHDIGITPVRMPDTPLLRAHLRDGSLEIAPEPRKKPSTRKEQ